jgi:hypothetical protein
MNKPLKIKLSENAKGKGSVSDFSVSYSSKKMDSKRVSYKIISALKGDGDIIIEIDSSLLIIDENEKDILKQQLTDAFGNMGLTFINKKNTYEKKRSILSLNIESKRVEGYKIYIYTTDSVWNNQEFIELLPESGVRYYISEQLSGSALNDFTAMDEEERFGICDMVIFDNISLGSMGILTSKNKDEISDLLGNILAE